MPDMSAPLKLGADIWNHHTDWPAFKAAQLRAEALGYDSLWAPDHIYPPEGPIDGPILEPYMLMAPIAALTSRATVGLMVSANTYRNPALLTKMVTTLDHLSGGRAILGIGSAWSEPEHRGFGFEFGDALPNDCVGSGKRCRSSGGCSTAHDRVPPAITTTWSRPSTSLRRFSDACLSSSAAAGAG